jgi:two-component system, NarL family, response regulator LiaR
MTSKTRVLLADDHQLVRAGVRALLDAMPDVEVVAEAGDGFEALHLIGTLAPAIALLDIAMPGMSGIDVLREVRRLHPATRVLLLSMYDSRDYVTSAVQAGAAGYLIKDAAVTELAQALQAVAAGQTYLSPRISRQLADAIANPAPPPATAELTLRQEQVLRQVARGHSSKEIARQLGLSIKTVETHRAQIMERLGIHDLAGLVRYAVRNGLVSSEE